MFTFFCFFVIFLATFTYFQPIIVRYKGKNRGMNMNSIFDYLDYRDFLKERIDLLKQTNPAFSYRYFNKKSGLKSSGHLKLIMDGKRNLTKDTMYKLCKGLGLSNEEASFFERLVFFNQAKGYEEKNHFYKKVLKSYPEKHTKIIDAKYYNIFSNWYCIAILELIRLKSFQEDSVWISNKLNPTVPPEKVEQALKDLEDVGLIVRDEETGKFVRADEMIATPDEVRSIAIINFHEQITKIALNSLKCDPVEEKEFSSLTIALSEMGLTLLKKKMQEFRREVHLLLESAQDEKTDVVQLDLHLFKLTQKEEEL